MTREDNHSKSEYWKIGKKQKNKMTAFKHKKSSSKSFCRVQFATRWRCGSRPVLLKPVNNFLFEDSVDHNVRLHLTRCDPRLRNLSVHTRGGIIKLYCHRLDPLPVSESLTSFFFFLRRDALRNIALTRDQTT